MTDIVLRLSQEDGKALLRGKVPKPLRKRLQESLEAFAEYGDNADPITSLNLRKFLVDNQLVPKRWGNSVPRLQALMHVLRYRTAIFQWRNKSVTQQIFRDLADLGLVEQDPYSATTWLPSEKLLRAIRKSRRPIGRF